MGYRELIEAITREGEATIAQIRRETDAEGERIRSRASAEIGALREKAGLRLTAAVAEARHKAIARGMEEGRLVRLEADQALAERLYILARSCIGRLRSDPGALFALLAAELPDTDWERVAVNPADRTLAAQTFTGAMIVDEPAISGGFALEADNGRIRIVNSLEKRLERGWPELLPEIFRGLSVDEDMP